MLCATVQCARIILLYCTFALHDGCHMIIIVIGQSAISISFVVTCTWLSYSTTLIGRFMISCAFHFSDLQCKLLNLCHSSNPGICSTVHHSNIQHSFCSCLPHNMTRSSQRQHRVLMHVRYMCHAQIR